MHTIPGFHPAPGIVISWPFFAVLALSVTMMCVTAIVDVTAKLAKGEGEGMDPEIGGAAGISDFLKSGVS